MYELKAGSKLTWGTPYWIIAKVARIYGKAGIDLDPAGNRERILPFVKKTLFPPRSRNPQHPDSIPDGLSCLWEGNVFVNPPYGPALAKWFNQALDSQLYHWANVMMLAPANTARHCWQNAGFAASICFLEGRVTFEGAENGAGFASALIFWTADETLRQRFEREWMDDGLIVRPVSSFS